jgi:phospholipid/cholesterol/gamma-HCH transport system substrate-binding protein
MERSNRAGDDAMTQGRELVVGSVIIAALVVVVVGTLWLQGTNFGRTTTRVEVLVRDVGQLTEGNAVKFRGVTIGRVADVLVEPGGNAVRLVFELEGDVTIAEDAAVLIAPESLFGDWQAEIVTRSGAPEFAFLDVAPADRMRDTLVLGGYAIPDISRLTAAADQISQNLRRLTDRFDRAFTEETADQLRQAIANVEAMSTDIRELIGQQASTFANVSAEVERAASEISASATQARVTLESLDRTLTGGEVDSILVSVRNATESLEQIASELEGVDSTLSRADSTFGSLQRLATRVEKGEGSLGRLLTDSTLALRLESSAAQLDSLLADVKANPRRYVRLSIF